MSYDTSINESVKVWAFFDPSAGPIHILPIAMNWRRRLIKFKKLIFASSKKIGETKLIRLVCASDSGNFELEYNSENQGWKLKRVMPLE